MTHSRSARRHSPAGVRRSRWIPLLVGLACLVASPLLAGPIDDLFDVTRLHAVSITMSASDWSHLRATYGDNTYYNANLTIDGESIPNVAIRSRGSGTRNPVKPGLRVDINRNVDQDFHGMKSLIVDNIYNDRSFLGEQLSFALFGEMGILVPRESFARLTVNGEYWGLYALIEPVDKVFVDKHVDNGEGNLFDYEVPSGPPDQLLAWDFSLSRGDSVADYVPSPFNPKTNEKDLDATTLLEFIRTTTEAPRETFVEDISKFVDPWELLTYLAVEIATGELDGLTSPFGVNNFYLYQQEDDTFLFIPWDHDFNFRSPDLPIYNGIHRNRLIERLLADEQMADYYRATLRSVVDRYMNPGWMLPRIDSMVALIRDSVREDAKWRGGGQGPVASEQAFDDAVETLRNAVIERAASVDAQLDATHRRRAVRRP